MNVSKTCVYHGAPAALCKAAAGLSIEENQAKIKRALETSAKP
jgi:hypothetical protein